MKRILYILPAIVILAACNKETAPVPADSDEPVIRTISLSVDADNGESKATYADNTLAAMWEEGDKILALKGVHSQSDTSTDNACPLDMTSEPGGNEAKFSSDSFKTSTNADDEAYWYFAYPADAAAMSASVTRTWEWVYKYAYSNTVSVTIPGTQTGLKWIPYMFAATGKLADADPKTVAFHTLSACLAIRIVAATDGNFPEKIQSITIQSENNNLYGRFTKTVNDNDTKIELSAADFEGKGNQFVAEFNEVPLSEYRFNIPAGVDQGQITVTVVDDQDRSVTRRTTSNRAVEPGHKRNLNFAWKPKSSFVNVTFKVTANTTYSYYKAGNLEEANNMENRLKAICTADVTIGGVDNSDVSYKFSVDNADPVDADSDFNHEFSNLTLGPHSLVAIAVVNGITYKSDPVSFYITGLPYKMNEDTSRESNWQLGSADCKIENSYIKVFKSSCSLSLNAPDDIETLVSYNASYFSAWSVKNRIILKVGSEIVLDKSGDKFGAGLKEYSFNDSNKELTLSSGPSTVTFEHSPAGTATSASGDSRLYDFSIIYK